MALGLLEEQEIRPAYNGKDLYRHPEVLVERDIGNMIRLLIHYEIVNRATSIHGNKQHVATFFCVTPIDIHYFQN